MIVVTHEMQFAREVASQVIFMADGVVVEKRNAGGDLLTIRRRRQPEKFLKRI